MINNLGVYKTWAETDHNRKTEVGIDCANIPGLVLEDSSEPICKGTQDAAFIFTTWTARRVSLAAKSFKKLGASVARNVPS